MSEQGPHADCKRRERELESLVAGLSREIVRLGDELDHAEELIVRAEHKLKGDNGFAELKADEALRLAIERIDEARRWIRKHKRRKAFTTGVTKEVPE